MPKIIAVDFDGTLCEDRYPDIGRPNMPLINALRELKKAGEIELILWTCRNGRELENALRWCWNYDLGFDAVNENLQRIVMSFGRDTRKIYADLYIDDKCYESKFEDFNCQGSEEYVDYSPFSTKFVRSVIECRMEA